MPESTRLRPRTAIFGKRVGEAMASPPPQVGEADSCQVLIDAIRAVRSTSAVVLDDQGQPVGIVTEQDVLRRVVFEVTPETEVGRIMTKPVRTIPAWELLYQAIGRMLKWNLRHLPVVDETGAVVGMLHLNDALADAAGRTLNHIRKLTWEDGLESVARVRETQARLAGELLAEEMDAIEIQRLLTHVNNDIYARVTRRRLKLMEEAGRGKPPVEFCLLVMGSGGRGENFLRPDQDHGMILDDYDDAEHNRIDAWFREFVEGLIDDLEEVGFPRDAGYVMSINPVWRKTLSQWKAQTRLWAGHGSAMDIRLGDIFFDFKPVFGKFELSRALREHINGLARNNQRMLQAMVHEHSEQGVALGFFDRFITTGKESEHPGHINIKHTGTLPLVAALRLLALRHGINATGSLERMEALNAAGVVDDALLRDLKRSNLFLADLILRHQLAQIERGEKPDYYLHPRDLSADARARLKRALRAIRRLREQVRTEITGQVF